MPGLRLVFSVINAIVLYCRGDLLYLRNTAEEILFNCEILQYLFFKKKPKS